MGKTPGHSWPASAIERRATESLTPYARNARTHSRQQVAKIAASIKEWGWTTPILVDEDDGVIAGHGRLLAAHSLGIAEVPVMVARGWTKAQKQAYVIVDNQLAVEASWDRNLLKVEIGELATLDFDVDLLGFPELELKGLMSTDGELDEGYEKTSDKPENPVTQSGDLWQLGKHRLLCGDATDENAVTHLLDGARPKLMVTDPPYGVEYDPEWRKEAGVSKTARTGKVQNDDRVDWSEAYKLFAGDVVYIWHSSLFTGAVQRSIIASGFEIRAHIIWAKSRFALSRGNYHWQHEPCWYAVRKGKKAHWIGDRSQSTVWQIGVTDDGDATRHGTQKPLECMGRPVRNHDAESVYEPFAGSGTTLIACELLNRACFAMELDPGYVDVIIHRWQGRTGQQAVRERDGKAFGDIKPKVAKT